MSALENSPRITPFLWFDHQAEEAADFYVGIFKNSRRTNTLTAPPNMPNANPKTNVLTVAFELDGTRFTALNGGPGKEFSESISFVVWCDDQQEVDHYWSRLTEDGGSEIQCGWLKDKFGLRWQITPRRLPELIRHPAAFAAMMHMKKIDIGELERAAKP